ncbi:MAG: TVP38/TMEM64 family protein [Clostridia bacterium]|nr:TVP38/TMEM64 family protein [Clostridia bacterium]
MNDETTRETPGKKKKIITLFLLALALVCLGLFAWFVGRPMVRFASEPEQFRAWVDQMGFAAYLGYIGMVVVQIIVAFIPGEPFEIIAGYAFGPLLGSVLCVLASVIGSMLVFLLVRVFGTKLVSIFFSKEKIESVRFLKSSPKRNLLFLIIFLIPGTPKDLLCYVAGLTDMSPWFWLFICSVGRLPSILTSTLGGSAIGSKNYDVAAVIFGATLIISGIGILIYRKIGKKHNAAQAEAEEDREKNGPPAK